MEETQKFQKPWQIALLNVHARVEKVVAFITKPLDLLNPTTQYFQRELNRKPLSSVK